MRKIIGWILNHIPRPLMQRVASWAVPMMGLLYVGRGKECPICGARRRKFLPYGYVTQRQNALCPNCLSLERHRLLWLYLRNETTLFEELPTLLHIAPEITYIKRFKRSYTSSPAKYITADLESPLATMHFDVQEIPLADNFCEVIICNHIMEHIPDDRKAMRELHRIMKRGGWGVILSPIDYSRAETFEDDSITDPKLRTEIFGQYDHRRIYGLDYAERLRECGFEVEEVDYFGTLTPEQRELYALTNEIIYIVRKS
ncbi:MAG: methyltransferase domain-containing protein [Rikenellaceae bacterium]